MGGFIRHFKNAIRYVVTNNKVREEWPLWLRINRVKAEYYGAHGRKLDLKTPKLFTEKIQWYRLFYATETMHVCTDKVRFKQFIEEKLGAGYTAQLLGVWDNIEDLAADWEKLPESFCIKSNLQSDGNAIEVVKNKSEINLDNFLKETAKWLDPKNTALNWQTAAYYGNEPMILAEEYLNLKIDGVSLDDYKFFCFDGEPKYIYVASEQMEGVKEHSSITFYTTDWTRLNVKYGSFGNHDNPRPKHLDEMLSIARILSAEFPFVRVDFYDLPEHVLLGEMTFDPAGGLKKFNPESFDLEMGEAFHLPEPNITHFWRNYKKEKQKMSTA